MRTCGFPVFAGGVTHRGPYKNRPGEINHPIAINGLVIAPGDLIAGDEDGLVCVYHQPGVDLPARVIPADNILFASEMIGAVRSIDPETGHHFDDTRRYLDHLDLDAEAKEKIFWRNALRVYPRLTRHIEAYGLGRDDAMVA